MKNLYGKSVIEEMESQRNFIQDGIEHHKCQIKHHQECFEEHKRDLEEATKKLDEWNKAIDKLKKLSPKEN